MITYLKASYIDYNINLKYTHVHIHKIYHRRDSRRKLNRLIPTEPDWLNHGSRINNGNIVWDPAAASNKAGLSCNLNPLRNQCITTEPTAIKAKIIYDKLLI